MVTATSSRTAVRLFGTAALLAAAVAVAVAGCQSSSSATGHPGEPSQGRLPPARVLAARSAPAGWHVVTMPNGGAVLAYPPTMHRVSADHGAVSAAQFSSSGAFLMYLNATPKQNNETLRDWPHFRLEHLIDDTASKARLLAARHGVRFLGGTGTCVIDTYVTKAKAHRYTELACFVKGKTRSSVIIAAAPAANWATASGPLMRAVAAYQVR